MTAYLMGVAAPLLSGFILNRYAFEMLFMIGLVGSTLAIIPLMMITEIRETYSFSFFQTWKELLRKENTSWRKMYIADGLQDIAGIAVWPIFIYLLLDQKYLTIGAISALIIACTLILQIIVGIFTDRSNNKEKIFHLGVSLYSAGWILKALVASAFHIFIAGTIHNLAAIIFRTSFDTITYERAADYGSYVDEFSVMREIALGIGRMIGGALIILVIYLTDLNAAFFIAALGGIALSFMTRRKNPQPHVIGQ